MEDKLRKLLKHIADAQINLTSEFARNEVLADIMKIIEEDNNE